MPAVFHYPHVVTEEEIDALGHVNNLCYLRWVVEAAVAHSTAQGWPPERYVAQGAGWVARSHFIRYLQPAFVGDRVVVQTWVSHFKKVTSLRKYRIVRPADQAVLAVAETDWAFVSLREQKPRRIPAEVAQSFVVVPPDREPDGEVVWPDDAEKDGAV